MYGIFIFALYNRSVYKSTFLTKGTTLSWITVYFLEVYVMYICNVALFLYLVFLY